MKWNEEIEVRINGAVYCRFWHWADWAIATAQEVAKITDREVTVSLRSEPDRILWTSEGGR